MPHLLGSWKAKPNQSLLLPACHSTHPTGVSYGKKREKLSRSKVLPPAALVAESLVYPSAGDHASFSFCLHVLETSHCSFKFCSRCLLHPARHPASTMLVVNLSALKSGHQFRVWSAFCELWWKGEPTLAKAAQQHTQQTHVCCFSISLGWKCGPYHGHVADCRAEPWRALWVPESLGAGRNIGTKCLMQVFWIQALTILVALNFPKK